MASSDEVKEFVDANPPAATFTPYVRYSQDRDCLQVYLEGDADYSAAVPGNDSLGVMRSLDDERIVGVTIYGLSQYIKTEAPNG